LAGIEKALNSIGSLNLLSLQDTAVHRLDPRSKIIVTIFFIFVTVSFSKYELSGLLPLIIYPVASMSLGRIPLKSIGLKILAVSPFAIAIGIANPFIDRQIIMNIGSIGISGGAVSFISIILKFVLTVGTALTLVATTGFETMCAGLIRFKIPRVFAVQLLFMYRYIFVLFDEALRMLRAHSLRSFRAYPDIRILGSLIGQLLLRSLNRAERIHNAMISRGFDGEIRIMKTMKMRPVDYSYIILWCMFFFLCRTHNLAQSLGTLIIRITS
jgi:cobalt/nickel transport system permease protein